MNNLIINQEIIPSMREEEIERVREFETQALTLPQVKIDTKHLLHAGLYARSIMIPAGVILTGALIKIATILIIQGDVVAYIGEKTLNLSGYNVLAASANRKQAFLAKTEVNMTMLFPCDADNVTSAEDMFTDEADTLISRKEIS